MGDFRADHARDGRVLVITGAGTGIGAATAHLAVAAGWGVVLAGRRREPLEAVATAAGPAADVLVATCDVAEWEDVQELSRATMDRFGRIDAVFANAGFGAERGWMNSTPEHWRSMVLTNVYGAAITVRAMLPELIQRQGHVLITSSTAGRRVLPGSMYSVTKHAATAMGEALRQEVAEAGVRVTLVEPGMTDTPFFDNAVPDWSLTADDIARATMFALEQPPHVTVAEVMVRPTGQVF